MFLLCFLKFMFMEEAVIRIKESFVLCLQSILKVYSWDQPRYKQITYKLTTCTQTLTCSVEGLMTFCCTETFSCEAFSPAWDAQLLALVLKVLQPVDREVQALDSNSFSSFGGGWPAFPKPEYFPPWLGGRSLWLAMGCWYNGGLKLLKEHTLVCLHSPVVFSWRTFPYDSLPLLCRQGVNIHKS